MGWAESPGFNAGRGLKQEKAVGWVALAVRANRPALMPGVD